MILALSIASNVVLTVACASLMTAAYRQNNAVRKLIEVNHKNNQNFDKQMVVMEEIVNGNIRQVNVYENKFKSIQTLFEATAADIKNLNKQINDMSEVASPNEDEIYAMTKTKGKLQ